MRLTLTALGHTLDVLLGPAKPDEPAGSDQPLDALVDLADRHDVPGFGFRPPRHNDEEGRA